MMPDLGEYAAVVLSAYAVTFVALGALIAAVLLRAKRVRAELAELEENAR